MVTVKLDVTSSRVKGVAFHPKLPLLLTSLHSGEIQLWDYDKSILLETLEGHIGPVRGIDFHSRESLFVSGGDDCQVVVWDFKFKRRLFALSGHSDYIRSVCFHHRHPWIVSSSDDQTFRIWNWQSRSSIYVLTGHCHYVMCAKFHPSKDLLLTTSLDHTARVWSTPADLDGQYRGRRMQEMVRNDNGIGLEDFGLTCPFTLKFLLEGHEKGVNCGVFHPILQLIVTCSDDKTIRIWRYTDDSAWQTNVLRSHTDNVSSVMYHPGDYSLLVSNSEDCTVKLWSCETWDCLYTFKRKGDRFWTLGCSEHMGSRYIAAGHDSGYILMKLMSERPLLCNNDENNSLYFLRRDVDESNIGIDQLYLNDPSFTLYLYKSKILQFGMQLKVPGHFSREKLDMDVSTKPFQLLLLSRNSKRLVIFYNLPELDSNRFKIQNNKRTESVPNGEYSIQFYEFPAPYSEPLCCCFMGKRRIAVGTINHLLILNCRFERMASFDLPTDKVYPASNGAIFAISQSSLYHVKENPIFVTTLTGKPINIKSYKGKHLVVCRNSLSILDAQLRVIALVYDNRIKSALWDGPDAVIYTTSTHLKFFTFAESMENASFSRDKLSLNANSASVASNEASNEKDLTREKASNVKEKASNVKPLTREKAINEKASNVEKVLTCTKSINVQNCLKCDCGVLQSLESVWYLCNLEGEDLMYFTRDHEYGIIRLDMLEYRARRHILKGGQIGPNLFGGYCPSMNFIGFLRDRGHSRHAFGLCVDPALKFSLAKTHYDLNEMYCVLEKSNGNWTASAWHDLANMAMKQCNIEIAEKGFKRVKDAVGLANLYMLTGQFDKLGPIATGKIATPSSLTAALYLNGGRDLAQSVQPGFSALDANSSQKQLTIEERAIKLETPQLSRPIRVWDGWSKLIDLNRLAESMRVYGDESLTPPLTPSKAPVSGAWSGLDDFMEEIEVSRSRYDVDLITPSKTEVDISKPVDDSTVQVEEAKPKVHTIAEMVMHGQFDLVLDRLHFTFGLSNPRVLMPCMAELYQRLFCLAQSLPDTCPISMVICRSAGDYLRELNVHLLARGHSLVTSGDFINALDIYRKIMHNAMLAWEDETKNYQTLEFTKARNYSLAMALELKRAELADVELGKSLQLAASLASLDLEEEHKFLVLRRMMGIMWKAGNYKTTADIAKILIDSKVPESIQDDASGEIDKVKRILQASSKRGTDKFIINLNAGKNFSRFCHVRGFDERSASNVATNEKIYTLEAAINEVFNEIILI